MQEAINKTKKILRIPDNYLVGIVPGSDTGAIEMAMWNVLSKTGVDIIYFESFGKGWYNDIKINSKLKILIYMKLIMESYLIYQKLILIMM